MAAGQYCNPCKTATATRPLTIWCSIPVRAYRGLRSGCSYQTMISGTCLLTIGEWVRLRRTCRSGALAWRSPTREDTRLLLLLLLLLDTRGRQSARGAGTTFITAHSDSDSPSHNQRTRALRWARRALHRWVRAEWPARGTRPAPPTCPGLEP